MYSRNQLLTALRDVWRRDDMERKPRSKAGELPGLVLTYLASLFVTPDVRELPGPKPIEPDNWRYQMSEQIETRETIYADITLQQKRLKESAGEPILLELFQARMDRALDRLSTFNEFVGEVSALGSTAVVLFERSGGENIVPGEN